MLFRTEPRRAYMLQTPNQTQVKYTATKHLRINKLTFLIVIIFRFIIQQLYVFYKFFMIW